jgi:hypothetical protein
MDANTRIWFVSLHNFKVMPGRIKYTEVLGYDEEKQ